MRNAAHRHTRNLSYEELAWAAKVMNRGFKFGNFFFDIAKMRAILLVLTNKDA